MYRMLTADLRRLFRNRSFHFILIGYAFIYTSLSPAIIALIDLFKHDPAEYADSFISDQAGTVALVISVFTSLFLIAEFTEGSVRNKLSTGAKRSEIFLSVVVTMIIASFCIQAVSFLSIIISGNLFMAGFESPVSDIILINLVYFIAISSIAAFDTALIYIFTGEKITAFLGTIIAVIMKLASMAVVEGLFAEDGSVKLTGSKLIIFSTFDKYVPFAHLTGLPRYGWDGYITGALILGLFSVMIGLLIFSKRDIK